MTTQAHPVDPKATVPEEQAEVARITYKYLRWLMVLLPAVLLVVTVLTALQQGELESSISAYYGGPVRDVFVGVMVATAACMVAYQGASLLEDYTLNEAGFYALFVALVRSGLAGNLDKLKNNPTPDGITAADYIWSLRWALTTVVVLCALLVYKEVTKSKRLAKLWECGKWHQRFVGLTAVVLVAFLALAIKQLWFVDANDVSMDGIPLPLVDGRLRIHDLAAIFLIAALAVAVWTHAFPRAMAGKLEDVPQADLDASGGYQLIFWLMVVGPVPVLFFTWLWSSDHMIIALEWWEILLFGVFWLLETKRVGRLTEQAA